MQVQETQIKTYHTVSLANVVTRVPSEDVEFIWSQIKPLLEKALDETYTIDDIYKGLIEDRMQLFISWNDDRVESAVVTEIAQYPQSKVLRYFLAGGVNLENWLERIQKVIEKFAKKENCTHLEVAGRKGWVRKLKGFRVKAYLLNKEI
jgi:UTP-glucose-1-phosphate uridylyltransferase